MKLTPILLIPLLFLSSCTIDWNDEKDKKIFENSRYCIEMTPKFEKQYNNSPTSLLYIKVISVFFSEKLNTCIVDVEWEGMQEKLIDGLKDKVLKYHFKAFETPTTLCTSEQKNDGCLDKKEFSDYRNELK